MMREDMREKGRDRMRGKKGERSPRSQARKPQRAQRLSLERAQRLLSLAEERFSGDASDRELSHRYAGLARRIAMRTRTRLPSGMRRRICQGCHHFLVPGKNCRIRLTKSKVTLTCLDCGRVSRHPYLREQKARRRIRLTARGELRQAQRP